MQDNVGKPVCSVVLAYFVSNTILLFDKALNRFKFD